MPAGRAPRILVVDDEPQIRATLSEALVMEGYEVAQAKDGAEALRIVEDDEPDVVVLDLRMPVFDGWAFRREQLRTHPRIPIVVLSAATLSAEQVAELGGPRVVAKPFDLDVLYATIRAALDSR